MTKSEQGEQKNLMDFSDLNGDNPNNTKPNTKPSSLEESVRMILNDKNRKINRMDAKLLAEYYLRKNAGSEIKSEDKVEIYGHLLPVYAKFGKLYAAIFYEFDYPIVREAFTSKKEGIEELNYPNIGTIDTQRNYAWLFYREEPSTEL